MTTCGLDTANRITYWNGSMSTHGSVTGQIPDNALDFLLMYGTNAQIFIRVVWHCANYRRYMMTIINTVVSDNCY